MSDSGYRTCACGGCFEITIGSPGELCDDCEEAGCADRKFSLECNVIECNAFLEDDDEVQPL